MKKRILSMLLAVVMLLGMLPGIASAANSVEEALGEVYIYNGGQKLSYLSINGRVRELIYTYYNYLDRNGQTKEVPAYCVNPNTKGVPQTVAEGESIKYLAEEIGTDPKVMGIIASGYPHRSLGELKLENKYQAYYSTKMALWCYLLSHWDINNLKVNPDLTGVELERANKILAAAKDIYRRGTAWSTVLSPNVTVEPDQEVAYPATVNGQEYLQQIFTVTSETWVCDYAINVAFTDPSAVPAGTKIVDMDNKEINVITTKATGNGYSGQFKVLYPVDSVEGQSGSVQLSFRTNVYKYAIYYAVCAETDKYGNLQNYMCDTDPTTPLALTAYSNYTDTPEEDPSETSLKIIKYAQLVETLTVLINRIILNTHLLQPKPRKRYEPDAQVTKIGNEIALELENDEPNEDYIIAKTIEMASLMYEQSNTRLNLTVSIARKLAQTMVTQDEFNRDYFTALASYITLGEQGRVVFHTKTETEVTLDDGSN